MSNATPIEGIKACVFDAYGTLFDVHSAVGKHRSRLGEKADAVSGQWRTKQLEYTWLRSLMGSYKDFWEVTADALDYALESHGVDDQTLRQDLLQAYLQLDAYPEVHGTLAIMRDAGIPCCILTNGSPDMIAAAVASAKLDEYLEPSLSVASVGVFKPDASVYQLAVDALGVEKNQICFQSSNAWDAAGAAHFGFRVAWINRFGQKPERLPGIPDAEFKDLSALPKFIGAQ